MTTSTHNGHSRFWPTEPFGRWSVGSVVLFGLGGFGLTPATALGQTGGETFSDNWWGACWTRVRLLRRCLLRPGHRSHRNDP